MIDEKLIDRENSKEHYVRKGDPAKPTYYIIRPQYVSSGLFWHFTAFAGHIRYALSKGWVPVVDMQNYQNAYLAPEKFGKENAWEYFFEQPMKVDLKKAFNGENVILSGLSAPMQPNISINFNEENLAPYKELVRQGFLKVKAEISREVLAVQEKLFKPTDKVLGIKLRGTDYTANKPKWHYIPPSISLAEDTVRTKLKEWNCNKIFLATEDRAIEQNFKNIFGDICVTFDKEFVNYIPGKCITSFRINREDAYFLQGKEYLIEMLILSKCNSLIMTRTFGTVGVMIFGETFEHTYFFDLGRYGV